MPRCTDTGPAVVYEARAVAVPTTRIGSEWHEEAVIAHFILVQIRDVVKVQGS